MQVEIFSHWLLVPLLLHGDQPNRLVQASAAKPAASVGGTRKRHHCEMAVTVTKPKPRRRVS